MKRIPRITDDFIIKIIFSSDADKNVENILRDAVIGITLGNLQVRRDKRTENLEVTAIIQGVFNSIVAVSKVLLEVRFILDENNIEPMQFDLSIRPMATADRKVKSAINKAKIRISENKIII